MMIESIGQLSDREAERLLYDWSFWARPDQLPPPGSWTVWLLRGGRGSGKTRTGAEFVVERARQGYRRIALVGQTKGDVRDTMIEVGDSGILNCAPPWFRPQYEPSKRRLTFPNGCICIAYSGDEPDQLRGPQHDTAWVDELCKFKYPQQTWDNLEMGMRLSPDPRVVVTTTPRPIPILKRLMSDPSTVDVRCSTFDNFFLSHSFRERVRSRYEGSRLGRQELHGDVLEDNPDALWRRSTLEANRVSDYPDLFRIGIGVDPEVESGVESAETGIVAAGITSVGGVLHAYVLDDSSIRAHPSVWATAAVAAYKRFRADIVVGEVNNGGEMVGYTLSTADPTMNFKAVRATRGKYTRAEPISALYEQGRVHHVGFFSELEDQMCEWVPGDKSPDRLDALVWVLTELLLKPEEARGIVYYEDRVSISPF